MYVYDYTEYEWSNSTVHEGQEVEEVYEFKYLFL